MLTKYDRWMVEMREAIVKSKHWKTVADGISTNGSAKAKADALQRKKDCMRLSQNYMAWAIACRKKALAVKM